MATKWASLVGQDLEPASWFECVELLLGSGGDTALHRAHRCFEWELQSLLERVLRDHARRWEPERFELMCSMAADPRTESWALNVENRLTECFTQNAIRFGVPDPPETWDLIGWWEVMQHHGARLDCWTGLGRLSRRCGSLSTAMLWATWPCGFTTARQPK